MIDRKILAIEPESADSAASIIAALDCGHRRHIRHRPPLESHPWILDPTERAARVGQRIECGRCERLELPAGAACYKQMGEFTAATIPAGLRKDHTLKAGTWAQIVVLEGQLRYQIAAPLAREMVLTPGTIGVVPPEVPHLIEPLGEVRLRIDFYR
jgi:tellurite methyltransferase